MVNKLENNNVINLGERRKISELAKRIGKSLDKEKMPANKTNENFLNFIKDEDVPDYLKPVKNNRT